ncbi:unnamed protein product [Discula destructiva]
MQFTTISMSSVLASIVSAAPAVEPRQFQAQLHFFGAAGAEYSISAPTTANSVFTTGHSLAVDNITLEGGATCTLFGVDGGSFTIVGASTFTVGPPQAIASGSCLAL